MIVRRSNRSQSALKPIAAGSKSGGAMDSSGSMVSLSLSQPLDVAILLSATLNLRFGCRTAP